MREGKLLIEREEVKESPRITVLLVVSAHIGWAGLRSILLNTWVIRIVGDTSRREEATRLAEMSKPVIVFAPATPTEETALLVQVLSETSPASRLILVGNTQDHGMLSARVHVQARRRIAAFLCWEDLTEDAIIVAIEAVRGGLQVRSAGMCDEPLGFSGSQAPLLHDSLHLTKCERAVLEGLAAGSSEKLIAQQVHVSLPTLYPTIASLKSKLDASTLFTLGVRTRSLGLDASAEVNTSTPEMISN